MEGGVVVIKFEADVSDLKNVDKVAKAAGKRAGKAAAVDEYTAYRQEKQKQLQKAAKENEAAAKQYNERIRKVNEDLRKWEELKDNERRKQTLEDAKAFYTKMFKEQEAKEKREEAEYKESSKRLTAIRKEREKEEKLQAKQLEAQQKAAEKERLANEKSAANEAKQIEKQKNNELLRIKKNAIEAQKIADKKERDDKRKQNELIRNNNEDYHKMLAWATLAYQTQNSQVVKLSNNIVKLTGKASLYAMSVLSGVSAWKKLYTVTKQYLNLNTLKQFASKSIEYASQLTEIQNVVDIAFPNMSKAVDDFCINSINKFGLSEISVKKYTGTLGLLAENAGLMEQQAYKLGTGLTALTSDLASVFDYQFEDVYQKIRSGVISGMPRPLRDLGIDMTATSVQAWMDTKGIDAVYTKLSAAEKIAIRYNYAIESAKLTAGDFIKTQYTWANQTRILNENIKMLMANFGTLFISLLNPLLIQLNKFIQLLTIATKKTIDFLSTLGLKIQKAASSGENSGMSDMFDDITEGAEEATDAAAKLTDGPFSELHKLGDDTKGKGGSLGLGSLFDLSDYKSPYELVDRFANFEEQLRKLFSGVDFSKLKLQLKDLLEEIPAWCRDIKQAWKDAWNDNNQGTKTTQAVVDLLTQALGFVDDISEAFRIMFESGWGKKLFDDILKAIENVSKAWSEAIKKIRDVWNSGSGHFGFVKKKEQTELGPNMYGAKKTDTGSSFLDSKLNGNDEKPDFRSGFQKSVVGADRLEELKEMDYRELTWGEYIAEQFYKVSDAIIHLAETIQVKMAEITAAVDWEVVFDDWAQDLQDLYNFLDDLGKLFGNIDSEEAGGGIQWLLIHLDDIAKWVVIGGAVISVLGTISGLLGKVGMTIFSLRQLGLISKTIKLSSVLKFIPNLLEKAVQGLVKFGSKVGTEIVAALQGAFQLDGLLGGLLDVGILAAFLTNFIQVAAGIISETFHFITDVIKGERGIGEIWQFLLFEVPQKCQGWLNDLFANIVIWLIEKFDGLYNTMSDFWTKVFIGIKGWWDDTLVPWAGGVWNSISGFFDKIKSAISSVIDKLKEFLGLKDEAVGSSSVIGGSNKKFNPSTNGSMLSFAKFSANGGAFVPNKPVLNVMGDNRTQMEYALTEGHLKQIAAMMSGNSNGNGQQPVFNIYLGQEQFDDYIVKAVNKNAFRGGM